MLHEIDRLSPPPPQPLASAPADVGPGEMLAAERKRRGYSLRSLAATIGLSYNQLHKIERGRGSLTVSSIAKLRGVFGDAWADEIALKVTRS